MFKVVPDQLRVSDGWVRCGQCNEVFDANAHLQSGTSQTLITPAPPKSLQTPVEQPEGPPPPPPAPAPPAPIQVAAPVAIVVSVVPVVPIVPKLVVAAPAIEEKAVAIVQTPQPEPFLEVSPRALHIDQQELAAPLPTLREQRDNLGRGDAPVRKSKANTADKPTRSMEEAKPTGQEQPQHSFMRKKRSPGVWSRPWVRGILGVVCVVLVGALFLQVAIHERDRIVATEPSARRFLEPLCGLVNCSIAPLRHIEAIVIDSSSFSKVRADIYRLSFVLKNSAQTAVATPAVELTLTDLHDQAVVRRVFTVAEFNTLAVVIEPGAELSTSVPVFVKPGTGQEKISGYRLLSFYP